MRGFENKKVNNWFCIFVCLICVATNLSQMPTFVESGITQLIALPVWVLLACICFWKDTRLYLKEIVPSLVFVSVFLLYFLIKSLFNPSTIRSALPYPVLLSLFVLVVGLMAGRNMNTKDLKTICYAYAISGVIVCVDVYFKYVANVSLEELLYSYGSKNSVSQILLTSMLIFLVFGFERGGILRKVFCMACIALLVGTMIGLKSRASLVVIPVILIRILFGRFVKKEIRWVAIVAVIAIVIILSIGNNYKILVENVLLGSRDATDMSAVSSGRSDEWAEFPALFAEAPLFGHGLMARESLIITALLEYGILGGSFVLLAAVYPLYWGLFRLNRKHEITLLFTSVAMCYAINGIFEQLAPFGPGVKCYFLWFLFGLLAAKPEQVTAEKSASNNNLKG